MTNQTCTPSTITQILGPMHWKEHQPCTRNLIPLGIECDVRQTTHQRHAEEIVCGLNETQTAELDGIVAVGGDGLFHEVVNGLLALRAARDGSPHAEVASSLRLGHIPAGSTDTVAYTLHGTRSVTTAAIRIVLGDRNPLDIARVDMLRSQTHTFAVSMISYGYLGDLMKVWIAVNQ